ncbi:glycerophosphodiester phosphodiesterase [Belliella marina]|uniref:Glycerophosphodiester phosphodiesterase n=1 Tax=Belliella marina TaxID=1644146 RepID=A0ABW4VRZ5_9BACT
MKNLMKGSFLCLLVFTLSAAVSAQESFLHNGVTAHRGNSSEFPENSMPAFVSALELGVDWIELDVFLSADGKVVVTHDKNLKRVSGVDMEIAAHTFDEISAVDITWDFRNRHQLSLKDSPKLTVPLLEDVLKLIVSQPKTRLSIQPKMDCVDEVFELIEKYQAAAWVGFNDANLDLMKKVKSNNSAVSVFWDRLPDTDIEKDIETARAFGFEALVIHYSGITAEKVRKVKEGGMEIGAWTVNDIGVMESLLELGVQRIYTDYPRELLKVKEVN